MRLTPPIAVVVTILVLGCAKHPSVTGDGAYIDASGTLPASWYAGGAECAGRDDFQVHAYNDDLYILRQSACTNFEKPFLYLIFGKDRALLLDTGAGKVDVAGTVARIMDKWLARNGRSSLQLVVAHSHGHGDHVAGDAQFASRPGVTLVGRDTASVRAFFNIARWPDEIVQYDLGDRIVDVIPIPGHQPAGIAVYDRRTALLLTGDTFYPGRLYVRDTAAFARSIRRLVDFTRDRPVAHILGTHIENSSTPARDYPQGTVDQPSEHALQLTRAQLVELDSVVQRMRGNFVRTVMADYTVWP